MSVLEKLCHKTCISVEQHCERPSGGQSDLIFGNTFCHILDSRMLSQDAFHYGIQALFVIYNEHYNHHMKT